MRSRDAVITVAKDRAPLCGTERVEAHRGAADPDAIAQPRREPVVHEHAQRLPHARNLREPVVEFADVKQAWMGLEERAQDGAEQGRGRSRTERTRTYVRYTRGATPTRLGKREGDALVLSLNDSGQSLLPHRRRYGVAPRSATPGEVNVGLSSSLRSSPRRPGGWLQVSWSGRRRPLRVAHVCSRCPIRPAADRGFARSERIARLSPGQLALGEFTLVGEAAQQRI